MRFKEWLQNEAGHFMLANPANIWVLYHGRPAMLQGVTMVDPRFEFMNVPNPTFDLDDPRARMAQGRKFLGQFTFSLPVVDPEGKRIIRWIVVPRENGTMLGGGQKAHIAASPEGVKAPLDWADHADIMDDSGAIPATYGGNVADAG